MLRMYEHTVAGEFSLVALMRQQMVAVGRSRKLINQIICRLNCAFKWAAREQLLPVAVLHALATVTGLQAGCTFALECELVRPSDGKVVSASHATRQPHCVPQGEV